MAARSRQTSRTAWATLWRLLRGSLRPGEPGLGERLRALPRLVRAVVDGEYTGTTGTRLAGLALAALYVLSPIDLVPEVPLGFLGLGDDAFVLSWLAARVLGETDEFLRWERAGGVSPKRRGFGRWRRRGEQHASKAGRPDVVPGHVVR